MNDQHHAALGAMVKRLIAERTIQEGDIDDIILGKMIVLYVEVLQKEAMRDAREEKNK